MLLNSYNPVRLSIFAGDFWLYEDYQVEHKIERILLIGMRELVINLRHNELRFYDAERLENCSRFSGAILSGAYGRGFDQDRSR